MSTEQTKEYPNKNALITHVVDELKKNLQDNKDPRWSYQKAISGLSNPHVTPTPNGVYGSGNVISKTREVDNVMRAFGFGQLVEGLQPGQRFVPTKRSIY